MSAGLSRSASAKKGAATRSQTKWAIERNRIQDLNTDWFWAIKEDMERTSNSGEAK
jgi:hypothetical protein